MRYKPFETLAEEVPQVAIYTVPLNQFLPALAERQHLQNEVLQTALSCIAYVIFVSFLMNNSC
jgi:hypothetical protein